jgi:hypothetical protein
MQIDLRGAILAAYETKMLEDDVEVGLLALDRTTGEQRRITRTVWGRQ